MTTQPYFVLGIETSGPRGGVALARGEEVVAEQELARGLVHGRSLIPTIRSVLAGARVDPRDLALVAVNRGPGSHTGLRVGLMAARTLAHIMAIPLVGIEAVELLGAQAGPDHPDVVVAVDARMDRVFGGVRIGGRWTHPPALQSTRELAGLAPDRAILVGSGAAGLAPWLADQEGIRPAPESDHEVRASTVAVEGFRKRALAARPEQVDAIYFTQAARPGRGA